MRATKPSTPWPECPRSLPSQARRFRIGRGRRAHFSFFRQAMHPRTEEQNNRFVLSLVALLHLASISHSLKKELRMPRVAASAPQALSIRSRGHIDSQPARRRYLYNQDLCTLLAISRLSSPSPLLARPKYTSSIAWLCTWLTVVTVHGALPLHLYSQAHCLRLDLRDCKLYRHANSHEHQHNTR